MDTNKQRQSGFYWVLLDGWPGWCIAGYIDDGDWVMPGSCGIFKDEDFDLIDERPQFYDHKLDQEKIITPIPRKNHHRLRKVFHKNLGKRK